MAWALYVLTFRATMLPVEMTAARAMFVFALTTAMCSASAIFALRTLRTADPAKIF